MENIAFGTPPRSWEPRLNSGIIRFMSIARRVRQEYFERVSRVDVQGLEHIRSAIKQNFGILITCNHPAHADPFVFLRASDILGSYFYYMSIWQSFHKRNWIGQLMLQWHGSFSINREGIDMRAYDRAIEIIQSKPNPLVIFAEGRIYHHYQRVAPFRDGASLFAQAAAQRAHRRVVCIPAAIVYRYLEEPYSELARLLSLLERKLGWQPTPRIPLATRVRRVAEGFLELRERNYLGQIHAVSYCERAETVLATILERLEIARGLEPRRLDISERVTRLRRLAIEQKTAQSVDREELAEADRQLRDLQVVAQLHTYMHDFETDEPTFEHLAEIIDKLEEDLLGAVTATTRGRRRAYIRFGQPLPVETEQMGNMRKFTGLLHDRVQSLVDGLISDCGPWRTLRWTEMQSR